jgi:siroheme synthase-like protein
MFVDLSEKNILVVGAGRIAARRIQTLLDFAPRLTVVAPELSVEVEALVSAGRVDLRQRGFAAGDLDGVHLVLTATGDPAVDGEVCKLCRERGIPVNAASDKSKCDFLFPGIAHRENVVIGVTAGGEDHAAARKLTEAARGLIEDVVS